MRIRISTAVWKPMLAHTDRPNPLNWLKPRTRALSSFEGDSKHCRMQCHRFRLSTNNARVICPTWLNYPNQSWTALLSVGDTFWLIQLAVSRQPLRNKDGLVQVFVLPRSVERFRISLRRFLQPLHTRMVRRDDEIDRWSAMQSLR